MDAIAQAEGQGGLAVDVEHVGLVVEPFVAGGRTRDQNGRMASRDSHPAHGDVTGRVATLVLRRGVVTQDLFDRSGQFSEVVLNLLVPPRRLAAVPVGL